MATGAAAHYLQLLAVVHGGTSTVQVLQLLLLVSSLLLLLVVATTSSRRRRHVNNNELQLPPSPPSKLPIIGHLHSTWWAPSPSNLAALLRLGAVPTLVVSSPRARTTTSSVQGHGHRSCSTAPGASPYGDEWRLSRKVVAARMLSNRKVESFRHGRLEERRNMHGLTRDNVKALLMEMFQASIESSYLVLDYAMAELTLNRHVMARLQTEIRATTPLMHASAGKKQDMVVMEEDLSKMPYIPKGCCQGDAAAAPSSATPYPTPLDHRLRHQSLPDPCRNTHLRQYLGSWERPGVMG